MESMESMSPTLRFPNVRMEHFLIAICLLVTLVVALLGLQNSLALSTIGTSVR